MAVTPSSSPEAHLYASLLNLGSRIGLVLLVFSFSAYVLGFSTPHVSLDDLPKLWSLPADTYLATTHSPQGWDWLVLATRGDFSNLLGIALLAGCSIPPLLAVALYFFRQKDPVYALICVAEVAVLVLAASGILSAGH